MSNIKANKRFSTILFLFIILVFFLGIMRGKIEEILSEKAVLAGSSIDWSEQYPFDDREVTQQNQTVSSEDNKSILEQYQFLISRVQNAVDYYCTHYIICRQNLLEINGYINRFLGKQVIEGVDDSIVQLTNVFSVIDVMIRVR